MNPTIVAMGGGGFSVEGTSPRVDDYILAQTGKRRPRVCFVPTASGDSAVYIERFRRAFPRRRAIATHLPLFNRDHREVARMLLAQDVIYVGGGNTANLLAIWRLHGVDEALRAAWRRGIVLCGVSAGALCWFEEGVTDSFGPGLAPLHDGLGLLRGSFCPHYDGERRRRPTYRRLVARGALSPGYAADDGAALVFRGRRLEEVVTSRRKARGYRVERGREEPIAGRYLPRG